MGEVVLKIENVSKQYRLGVVGTGTLSHDLKRWWHLVRGKEDPFLKIGQTNDREQSGGEYVKALSNINIEVNKGEIIGIIGKNGAGKSTLLKLLSQVTTPSEGKIYVKGRIAALLEVGTGFHPELTGRENIYLNGAILGMTKQEISSKFEEIVEFSGVLKYIDTPVKRYSSGMMVRLGFAVAAHLEPEILVVDEVLAVGDAEFQKKCIGKMKDVAGEGRTVIFVSHNMSSIRNLCNKGLVMHQGKVIYQGGVNESISRYLSENFQNSSDALIVDIPSENHKGTGEARFIKAYIENEAGKIVNVFGFRERLKIILELKVTKKIDFVNITIAIKSKFSETIAYGVSSNEKYEISSFTEGVHKIEIEMNENLMPDNFALGFGVYNAHSGGTIDGVEYFYPFQVNKETRLAEFEYPWATIHGHIEMKNKWNILQIN